MHVVESLHCHLWLTVYTSVAAYVTRRTPIGTTVVVAASFRCLTARNMAEKQSMIFMRASRILAARSLLRKVRGRVGLVVALAQLKLKVHIRCVMRLFNVSC